MRGDSDRIGVVERVRVLERVGVVERIGVEEEREEWDLKILRMI